MAARASGRPEEKFFPLLRLAGGFCFGLHLHAANVGDHLPNLLLGHAHTLLRRAILRHRRPWNAFIDGSKQVRVPISVLLVHARQIWTASSASRTEPMAKRAVRPKLKLSELCRFRIIRERVFVLRRHVRGDSENSYQRYSIGDYRGAPSEAS